MSGGVVTSANWSEVLQKTDQHGNDADEVGILLLALGLEVADVTKEDGEEAARLWRTARHLSLADRLCVAAAKRLDLPVVTAESDWMIFKDQLDVRVIR